MGTARGTSSPFWLEILGVLIVFACLFFFAVRVFGIAVAPEALIDEVGRALSQIGF